MICQLLFLKFSKNRQNEGCTALQYSLHCYIGGMNKSIETDAFIQLFYI